MVGAIGLGILSRPRADTQSPKMERVVHVDTTVFSDMSFRGARAARGARAVRVARIAKA